MIEKAHVCWYRIRRCGYYAKRGDPVAAFGELTQTLADMQRWGRGKQLGHTVTFQASEDSLPIYLLDLQGDNDAWVLTLWNETATTDGQVPSVFATSSVGSAQVVMNDVKQGTIPGFATYFFFVPSLSAVAAVRFQHLAYGHLGMRKYIDSYLKRCSSHVVFGPDPEGGADADVAITGYTERPGDELRQLHPTFKSDLATLPGRFDLLVSRSRDIVKVRRREVLNLKDQTQRDWWQRMLGRTGLSDHKVRAQSVRVQYDLNQMDDTFERDELRSYIDQWEAGAQNDEWNDVGFVLKGDSNHTHWLSHSVARGELSCDITRDSAEVVNAASLLRELKRQKPVLQKMLVTAPPTTEAPED